MENRQNNILEDVADYYTTKIMEHGDTPRGVDWNGEESQLLRFKKLLEVIDAHDDFSINDLGCGYGALYEYLIKQYCDFQYAGCDVSSAMIQMAMARYTQSSNAQFYVSEKPKTLADYGVASGIFNVRLKHKDSAWWRYLISTLDVLATSSRKGFAFNCLTRYSDLDRMRDYLYYADPCALFDHCKRCYSRHVTLFHDYDLYEFTIIVKK